MSRDDDRFTAEEVKQLLELLRPDPLKPILICAVFLCTVAGLVRLFG